MVPDSWGQVLVGVMFVCAVTVALVKLSKRSLYHDLKARDITKGHHWCYTGMFPQVRHLNQYKL